MSIEAPRELSAELKEIQWVKDQVKEELRRFNKETFYEKNGDEINYNMDTVKQYLGVLKEKTTWKQLISKNSSAMVMAVQIALYSQNYSFGNIDGILGEKTREAIRKFQADHNLPIDAYGRSMPSTIQKLLEVISRENHVEIPEEELQEAQNIMNQSETNTENDTQNTVDQDDDTVSTQIQELITHPSMSHDLGGKLEHISYADAIALSKSGIVYFNLSNVKEISVKAFEVLLKSEGGITIGLTNLSPELATLLETNNKMITFSNLENISMETYQILGKSSGDLNFPSLKNITGQEFGELTKKTHGNILLDGIESLTPELAEKIVGFPGLISLNGIKNISADTAKILSQKNVGKLYLKGLQAPLSTDLLEYMENIVDKSLVTNNEVLLQVYEYRINKEREGKDLSQIVLDFVDNKIGSDDLAQLNNISNDEAAFLVKKSHYYLNLSGVKNIDPNIFDILLQCKGGMDIGLDNLTSELAEKLQNYQGFIKFSSINKLDPEVCKILGNTKGTLSFDAIKNITGQEFGELTKKPGGDIYLDNIESIDAEIAEDIVKYPRVIMMNGVKQISKEAAKILSNKVSGRLFLNGLETPVDNDVLDQLTKIPATCLITNSNVYADMYRYKRENGESQE